MFANAGLIVCEKDILTFEICLFICVAFNQLFIMTGQQLLERLEYLFSYSPKSKECIVLFSDLSKISNVEIDEQICLATRETKDYIAIFIHNQFDE